MDNQNKKLLDQWREHHLKQGYQKFIYDGIINQDLWRSAEHKICLFLKEAYLKDDAPTADLCNWLNKYDLWRMWWVVSDWIYGIENTTATSISAYNEKLLNEKKSANNRIRSAAIINIKKSNGKSGSEHEDLQTFAQNDKEFIKKQFKEINPKIIICGNTRYYFEIVFGYDPENGNSCAEYNGITISHENFNKKGYIWAGDALIIDFCHPSNRFMRMGKYYAFCALYQQALIEKQQN